MFQCTALAFMWIDRRELKTFNTAEILSTFLKSSFAGTNSLLDKKS